MHTTNVALRVGFWCLWVFLLTRQLRMQSQPARAWDWGKVLIAQRGAGPKVGTILDR